MEDYNLSDSRGGFVYGGPLLAPTSSSSSSSLYGRRGLPISSFHLRSDGQDHPVVKTEAHAHSFHYPSIIQHNHNHNHNQEAIKSKIVAHPQYSNLLQAYVDCQKVGAPAEVVEQLTAVRREFETRQRAAADDSKDPELDQFMEAYYDMLVKYREELSRPLEEAMEFMRRIESQLNLLEEKNQGVGSSEEEGMDPGSEDRELKKQLLNKYSGYLGSLKQQLSKKKKKGKLPKDARQKLLTWWDLHYKWPYPSESEKVALADTTGLEQKQINNWFINQRKRHWKPSEDMQFMVMDPAFHAPPSIFMEPPHYNNNNNNNNNNTPNYRLPP